MQGARPHSAALACGGLMSYIMIVLVKVVQLVSTLLTMYIRWSSFPPCFPGSTPIPTIPSCVLRNATRPVFYRIRRWMPFVMLGGFGPLTHCGHSGGADCKRAAEAGWVIDMAMSARMMGALSSILVG